MCPMQSFAFRQRLPLMGGGLGGAIGGGLGVFAFGAGALPGAALGTQAGNLLRGFFGLKSVVVFMLDSLPRAVRAYQQGFFEAWGGTPDLRAHSMDVLHYGVDHLAAPEIGGAGKD